MRRSRAIEATLQSAFNRPHITREENGFGLIGPYDAMNGNGLGNFVLNGSDNVADGFGPARSNACMPGAPSFREALNSQPIRGPQVCLSMRRRRPQSFGVTNKNTRGTQRCSPTKPAARKKSIRILAR